MRIILNKQAREIPAHWRDDTLLNVLREHFRLTGAKFGCGVGLCGACTVIVDGGAARSCTIWVGDIACASVRTIEGLAKDGALHPVQQAWLDQSVPQCGYCQAGQIMTAVALLEANPSPTAYMRPAGAKTPWRADGRWQGAIRLPDMLEFLVAYEPGAAAPPAAGPGRTDGDLACMPSCSRTRSANGPSAISSPPAGPHAAAFSGSSPKPATASFRSSPRRAWRRAPISSSATRTPAWLRSASFAASATRRTSIGHSRLS